MPVRSIGWLSLAGLMGFVAACNSAVPPPIPATGDGAAQAVGTPVASASNSADPAGARDGPPWFLESAQTAGLNFTYRSGHTDRFLMPEIMGGGAALFDMDSDGDLDAYLVQAGDLTADSATRPPNQLFRNRGDGSFEDVTAGSGADDRGYGFGVAAGDYDNDGRTDLYVTNLGPNVLLHNEGDGRFTNLAAEAGVAGDDWSSSAAFIDFDRDGNLDLVVVNYIHWAIENERLCTAPSGSPDYCSPVSYSAPAQVRLYRNNGNGGFTDVSSEAGLPAAFGNGLGVVGGDFDGDGWIDVFVANDTTPNQLWINNGDGTFSDKAPLLGVAVDENGRAKAGMGTDAADVDGDGDLDLLVVNLFDETDSFFRNEGAYFSDATAELGLAGVSRGFTRFGMALADFDNDGQLDLYEATGRVRQQNDRFDPADPFAEPNLLFRGTTEGRFAEVLPRGGTDPPIIASARAAAFGDVDNDGGIDILVVNRDAPAHLLMNVAQPRGHWITLRVEDAHGRDALGARVDLEAGGRHVVREVRSAYSYQAANDPRVHVGLGSATTVDEVTVRWADGTEEAFGGIPEVDRVLTLRQGEGAPRP